LSLKQSNLLNFLSINTLTLAGTTTISAFDYEVSTNDFNWGIVFIDCYNVMFTFLSRNIKRFSTKLNSLNKFTDEEEMIREAGNK
jgi:hypothetical protein